jgi:hypothetical protein
VVDDVWGGEGGDERTEYLVGAVVRAAFGDGEGVVREAEEADYFDDGAEEGQEEWGVGVEV